MMIAWAIPRRLCSELVRVLLFIVKAEACRNQRHVRRRSHSDDGEKHETAMFDEQNETKKDARIVPVIDNVRQPVKHCGESPILMPLLV